MRFSRREALGSAGAAVLTLLALPFLPRLEVDNALEVWLDRDSAAYREYEVFRDEFGSEEFILLVYPCPGEIDLPFLERLTDLTFELEEIDGVRQVYDLARLYSRAFGLRGIEAFREELATSPFTRDFLISADGRLAATWVYLDPVGGAARDRVVAAVEEACRRAPVGGDVHLAGSPVLNRDLDRSSSRATRTFFPLVFALSAVLLLLLFRRFAGVAIPFVCVGSGIVWTLGLMAATGRSLNMVTVTLPPLLWVLGLSTSIHLLSRRSRALAEGGTPEEATRLAIAEVFRPCLFSALTTALGFASLMVSSVQPVREMGVFAAAGILLSFAANFLLFPVLARLTRRPPPWREDHPVLDVILRLERRPVLHLAAAALAAGILVSAIPRLAAESNPIEFFRDDAPIAVTYEQVLPGFTGPYSLEVTLEPPAVDLAALARVDELRAFLEGRQEVARVLSVIDLVKRAQQEEGGAYALPLDDAALGEVWRRLEEFPDELAAFSAGGILRLSVLARPMASGAHQRLVADLEDHLAGRVEAAWNARLTGIVPLLVDMQERLVESQIRTFGLAFLMIVLTMGILLRSARYALVSLPPNLLPVAFALGTMGWLEIRLDPATVMIAGIALGIAADDTIHFLEHYRRQRRAGRARPRAVEATLHAVGRPMVITSVVAALGFLALCFSDFVPLIHFGLLTAVTLVAALVGDLLVLPALLLIRNPGG